MRAYLLVGALAVMTTACDEIPGRGGAQQAEPRLSLSLDVSSVLDWGAVSDVQLTLSNQGNATSRRVHVELYLPSWLEFSSVEPEGTEVSLLRSGAETRLVYRLGDPALQPGETRTVVQRVRVPPRGSAGTATTPPSPRAPDDTAADAAQDAPDAAPQVPGDRTLRARLVSPEGEELGAELRTIVPFAGADNRAALPPVGPGTTAGAAPRLQSDRVGPVQLGASVTQLRAAAAGARDTTFTLEGQQERGLVVPVGSGRTVLALIVNDRVDRIIVRDRGVQTAQGLGVGSTFQQLRQAYGTPCVAPAAAGGTAAWFPDLPGVSFAFDVPQSAPQDTDAANVPPGAQVRELWVRRGQDSC